MNVPSPNLNYLIQFILGIALLIWACSNLYPIEWPEYRLVEQHLANWITAPILARIFVALKFFIGVSFLLNINPKNIFSKIFLGLLCISAFDLIWGAVHPDAVMAESYSSIFGSGNILSFLILLLNFLGCIILIKRKVDTDLKFGWAKYLLCIICLSLPFILNPVFPEDFSDQSIPIEPKVSLAQLELNSDLTKEERILIAFFSTSCPHCIKAAKKISIAQKKSDTFPAVQVYFLGSEEGVAYFFEESNTNFNYSIHNPEDIIPLSGPSLPAFILFENGLGTMRYSGRTLNFFALNQLCSS